MSNILLASAPSIEKLQDCARRFLFDASATVTEDLQLLRGDGRAVNGIAIVQKGKRYRMESIEQ
ncbi:hypothetical protein I3U41_16800 [Mycobacteroides abscessus subsp. abscessus]|uniref:hypothetical protein n=1 Tax=Mycobacteroides abscessus TaxID=36809 RepID=UPI0019D1F672|nr:hypothetical protein [Mycobacteroides abscessus]QSN19587.1 hypothetical protein I3U41_16800 [Mycobacteroides abscessus subsp. abscessus]